MRIDKKNLLFPETIFINKIEDFDNIEETVILFSIKNKIFIPALFKY